MEFLGGTDITIIIRLLAALLLGSLLGTERAIAGKRAGMRTYGLVAMGAALFVLAGLEALPLLAPVSAADVTRIIAGVITGVGFLGAGVIIFRETTVTGLTTAAGLWVAAGIGVASALGFYALAVAATILTLIAFTVFWFFEERVRDAAEDTHR